MEEVRSARQGKSKWFWIQVLVISLLTAKLTLAGFSFGRDWLSDVLRPEEASAQEKEKDAPKQVQSQNKAKSEQNQTPLKTDAPSAVSSTKAATLDPGQLELLRSIEQQRLKLEAREKELQERAQKLEKLQKLVNEKMAALAQMRQEFEAQVAAEEARQNKRMKHLVDLYSNMKPKAAAAVIEKMNEEIAVEIFRLMRGREAGKILAYVNPDKASRISQMLSEGQ
ncbi:MAG: hypothetical protein JRJ59_05240 [Deltaproteobacteria bacterium]|nr:hypothetical protein [Deltaproteobacteria bacterium]